MGKLRWLWVLIGLLLIPLYHHFSRGTLVLIGANDQVYYKGQATEKEAHDLGQALLDMGYFQGRGVTVQLRKGSEGTSLTCVVKEGIWDDPKMVHAFQVITCDVAPAIGGLPVKLVLADKYLGSHKELDVRPDGETAKALQARGTLLRFGHDEVYYSGTATEEEARALGNALQKISYFGNAKGHSVSLSKGTEGTVVGFPIKPGMWDDAKMVGNFESVARQVASAVGGLPVRLRLLDTDFVSHKEVEVKP